ANRESLRHSDFTNKAIIKRVDEIIEEIQQTTLQKFAACKDLFEVKKLYHSVFGKRGSFGNKLGEILNGKIIWNNLTINNSDIDLTNIENLKIIQFSKTKKKNNYDIRIIKEYTKRINCGNSVIYLNDLGKETNLKKRAATIFDKDSNINYIYILSFNYHNYKSFIEITKYDPLNFDKISIIQPKNLGTSFSGSYNPKNFKKIFKFNPNTKIGHGKGEKSKAWDIVEIDEKELEDEDIYYLIIDRYDIKSPNCYLSTRSLAELIKNLNNVGINTNFPIYGVKHSFERNFGNWIEFFDYSKKEVAKLLQTHEQEIFNKNHLESHKKQANEFNEDLIKKIDELNSSSLFRKYIEEVYINPSIQSQVKINDILFELKDNFSIKLNEKLKPPIDLDKLYEKMLKNYSMLKHLDRWGYSDKKVTNDIIEYINLIDQNGTKIEKA
ncbi:MAG: hypothetical protein AABY22_07050, partial [Nanoarchaeota archaeon]